jgi:type I restriction enzyme S subunit
LIVRTNGSRELIGRPAVVQAGVTAAFASYLIRFRIDQSRALPRWVSAVLGSPRLRMQIESLAASSAGQYNLSLGKLGPLCIPLPEIDVQRELLERIDDARVAVHRLSSECKISAQRCNTLRRVLLEAAFSGRLTGRSSDLERAEESIA